MSFSSKTAIGGKALAPVVDIFPQISLGYHDETRVEEEMRLLRSLGFERVYFVLCNPGYPMFSNPALCLQPPDIAGLQNFSFRSLVALGDPNLAYLRKCKEFGMEAFAILKPYESGGGATVPLGARMAWNPPRLPDIGGDRIGFDNLLTRHPELRVSRRPVPDYDRLMEQPVTGITASFFSPESIDREGEGQPVDIDASATSLRLFTSEDNGTYLPYEGSVDVRTTYGLVEIRDPNGFSVFPTPREGWTFHLEGFSFPPSVRYFALVLETGGKLYTIPQSMVSLHGASGPLPSTCSTHIRNGAVEDMSMLAGTERSGARKGCRARQSLRERRQAGSANGALNLNGMGPVSGARLVGKLRHRHGSRQAAVDEGHALRGVSRGARLLARSGAILHPARLRWRGLSPPESLWHGQ